MTLESADFKSVITEPVNLKAISDDQLLRATQSLVETERRITADAIKHFFEIKRRRLYLARGFSSLFKMLINEYRYCPATAMLRVNSVKLMVDVPEVIAKIESGEMLVSVVANIQSFLNSEAKAQKPYSREAKLELFETCLGKSVLEVQKEFVRRNPEMEKRESVRFTSEDRLRVSHSISTELEEKLQRIKLLWSNTDPNMNREDLLNRMAEITLDQIDPLRKAEQAQRRKAKATSKASQSLKANALRTADDDRSAQRSDDELHESKAEVRVPEVESKEGPTFPRTRYIKADDAHAVYEKGGSKGCEFVDESTGRVCGSHFQLQKDHIEPWSEGGSNSADNLRLLCAEHNRWSWRMRSSSTVESPRKAYA